MAAPNFMVFSCLNTRIRKAASATRDDATMLFTAQALNKARAAYKAKDYASALTWQSKAQSAAATL